MAYLALARRCHGAIAFLWHLYGMQWRFMTKALNEMKNMCKLSILHKQIKLFENEMHIRKIFFNYVCRTPASRNYYVNICRSTAYKMSRLMGKRTICICENKGADQLRGNREAVQRLCFRYSDSTIPLLLKSEISRF